jgi:pyruvate dehydrogenase E2 component (dihydrolipoamide acetyltransferase)
MTALAAIPIAMPRLSDAMEEATVVAWLKAPGDAVACGEALVEIETDKATVVYEAEQDGVLGELLVGEGEVAALGAPIAQLLVEGAQAAPPATPTPAAAAPAPPSAPTPAPPSAATSATAPPTAPPPPAAAPVPPRARHAAPGATRPRATPVARRVAAERGVDLGALVGSGPHGRIVRADVLAAAAAAPVGAPASPAAVADGDERVALSATQRTIARRMVASRSEIPEFALTAEVDMTDALALRRQLADAGHRVSVNDLVVKAAALALREHPTLNASWGGDHVVRHTHVNVGIAVAADDVLLVPAIADADRKSVPEIAAEARALSERARMRAATPAELSGATFTVTNLGMLGVLSFTAVIDAPQVAILAAGAVVRRPVFGADGTVVGRDLMHVTLTCDHRAVYGAHGARFLQRFAELLEHPTLLLLPPSAAATNDERDAR